MFDAFLLMFLYCLEHQNTQFWRKWGEYSLGPEVMRHQIEWATRGGELHPSFFTIGNRQLRERIIGRETAQGHY